MRIAVPFDVDSAADVLAAAFENYPFTRHTIDHRDHLHRLREFQRLFVAEIGIPHGRVWVSDDLGAVAVWTTPATDATAAFDRIGPRLLELAGDRVDAWQSAEAAMNKYRPEVPAWFLGTVGVRPDLQGRGLGRAIIQPGLAAADAEGSPCFLETSAQPNVDLYRRLGFDVVAEYELPDGGPHTWAMTREPRT